MIRKLFAVVLLPSAFVLAQGPARLATPLPALAGWRAASIHQADGGVWYAHVDQVVDSFGQPEVVATDDDGRFLLLSVYSGQWTAHSVVCDGLWLAPSRPADVDLRIAGRELYAGGRAGSIHQVTLRSQPFARFTLESREIGHIAGEEFHAIVAADLLPGGGDELLVFGITGAVYQALPSSDGSDFVVRKLADLPGRVRDVVVVPQSDGQPAVVLGASRSGHLLRMVMSDAGLQATVVLKEECGLGRIAKSPKGGIYYVTRDDGVLLRIAGASNAKEAVQRQVLYAGGQGLRGVAAGRFFADEREAVAVYGYDKSVHLIARTADGVASVETIFEAADRGHWLTVGELDGRNGTDELVATGFDGSIVLLAREPGYGLDNVAVPIEEQPAAEKLPPKQSTKVTWVW